MWSREAAVDLRRASAELALEIDWLVLLSTRAERDRQLIRILKRRAMRDAASREYRAACAADGVAA